jgi:large subunit ribosomal protein L4e
MTRYASLSSMIADTPASLSAFYCPLADINKNRRQPYSVAENAGHQTSAQSWGTGRAVSRIPRVGGGGTHRSGQGAFGNMCRKGRMFAPTKVFRRWHRKVNVNQRRYAIVSALAASAVPALVMARGHRIDAVPEVPLVVSGLEGIAKTQAAIKALEGIGAGADVDRARESKTLRAGHGKARGRRFVSRRGPLVIHTGAAEGLEIAFRNIPGVDLVHVDRLNLLQLAPGGHLGRFCVWTQGAFERLQGLFGSVDQASTEKAGYSLPRAAMANADLARLINSAEVQAVVRPAVKGRRIAGDQKKNPLTNFKALVKLNPYAAAVRKSEVEAQAARAAAKAKGKKARKIATSTRHSSERRKASAAKLRALRSEEFVRPQDA